MAQYQLSLPVFHTGRRTSAVIDCPGQARAVAWLRAHLECTEWKANFLWTLAESPALKFFFIFQSRDWTAQQLSVWHGALSRCQGEICKCLAVIPLYIKVNHANAGQNNSYKVIQRRKNSGAAWILLCILIRPKAGQLVRICELKTVSLSPHVCGSTSSLPSHPALWVLRRRDGHSPMTGPYILCPTSVSGFREASKWKS